MRMENKKGNAAIFFLEQLKRVSTKKPSESLSN